MKKVSLFEPQIENLQLDLTSKSNWIKDLDDKLREKNDIENHF